MATRLDRHQARKDALNALGRPLVRRCKSKCELCENKNGSGFEVKLFPHEVPPIGEEPELDRAVMICRPCIDGLEGGEIGDPATWRFLETTVWSEIFAVQVCAVRMLRRISGEASASWARDVLEGLYLDPEVEAWLEG